MICQTTPISFRPVVNQAMSLCFSDERETSSGVFFLDHFCRATSPSLCHVERFSIPRLFSPGFKPLFERPRDIDQRLGRYREGKLTSAEVQSLGEDLVLCFEIPSLGFDCIFGMMCHPLRVGDDGALQKAFFRALSLDPSFDFFDGNTNESAELRYERGLAQSDLPPKALSMILQYLNWAQVSEDVNRASKLLNLLVKVPLPDLAKVILVRDLCEGFIDALQVHPHRIWILKPHENVFFERLLQEMVFSVRNILNICGVEKRPPTAEDLTVLARTHHSVIVIQNSLGYDQDVKIQKEGVIKENLDILASLRSLIENHVTTFIPNPSNQNIDDLLSAWSTAGAVEWEIRWRWEDSHMIFRSSNSGRSAGSDVRGDNPVIFRISGIDYDRRNGVEFSKRNPLQRVELGILGKGQTIQGLALKAGTYIRFDKKGERLRELFSRDQNIEIREVTYPPGTIVLDERGFPISFRSAAPTDWPDGTCFSLTDQGRAIQKITLSNPVTINGTEYPRGGSFTRNGEYWMYSPS